MRRWVWWLVVGFGSLSELGRLLGCPLLLWEQGTMLSGLHKHRYCPGGRVCERRSCPHGVDTGAPQPLRDRLQAGVGRRGAADTS